MNDFAITFLQLSINNPAPMNYTLLLTLVGALVFIGIAIVNMVYSTTPKQVYASYEEKALAEKYNTLFHGRMKQAKQGINVDWETQKLNEIGDQLDVMRANRETTGSSYHGRLQIGECL